MKSHTSILLFPPQHILAEVPPILHSTSEEERKHVPSKCQATRVLSSANSYSPRRLAGQASCSSLPPAISLIHHSSRQQRSPSMAAPGGRPLLSIPSMTTTLPTTKHAAVDDAASRPLLSGHSTRLSPIHHNSWRTCHPFSMHPDDSLDGERKEM